VASPPLASAFLMYPQRPALRLEVEVVLAEVTRLDVAVLPSAAAATARTDHVKGGVYDTEEVKS